MSKHQSRNLCFNPGRRNLCCKTIVLTKKAEQTLGQEIAVLKELPIERIPGVLEGEKPEGISVLYRKCKPVKLTSEGLAKAKKVVKKMAATLKHYRQITETGHALAANQIGENLAIAIFLDSEGQVTPFINPKITWRSKKKNIYWEMCISGIPLGVDVVRPAKVKVRWYDLKGRKHEELFADFDARRIQHEIDHLQGKTCYHTEGTIYSTLGYNPDSKVYMNQKLRPVGDR